MTFVTSYSGGNRPSALVSYLRPGYRQLYSDAFHIPGSLFRRLDNEPPLTTQSTLIRYERAPRYDSPAIPPAPPEAPPLKVHNFQAAQLGAGTGSLDFLRGPDGHIYALPAQRPLGIGSADTPGLELRQAKQMRDFATEALMPESDSPIRTRKIGVTPLDKRLTHDWYEYSIFAYDQANVVPRGVTSVGAPAQMSEPTSVSWPSTITDPTCQTISGPALPLNRRKDALGRGTIADGDIDGPYTAVDNRLIQHALRQGDDRAYAQTQDVFNTIRQAEDTQMEAWRRELASADARNIAWADAQKQSDMAMGEHRVSMETRDLMGSVRLAEDNQTVLYERALGQGDADFARAAQITANYDSDRAYSTSLELSESNQRASDIIHYEFQNRLGVDMNNAYAYSRQTDDSGLLETGVPVNARELYTPTDMPTSATYGWQPVDVPRASAEAAAVSGYYPANRPADALEAAPAPMPVALDFLERPRVNAPVDVTSIPAVDIRRDEYRQEERPSFLAPDAEKEVRNYNVAPEHLPAETQNDVGRPIVELGGVAFNSTTMEHSSAMFQSVGLNSMAFAPLSVGVSFTV